VLRFLGGEHGDDTTVSLRQALATWAKTARDLGAMCTEMGIPMADDWYLVDETSSEDWYSDVLRHLEDGR
jgi:hypothetical protein